MNLESNPSTALSPEAIAQLVKGHREFLAFLERRVESRAVAEDILQAAFTRGLERGGDVQDEKVVAWFYRVLRNAVIDHYRQRSTTARAMEAWGREFPDVQEPEAELRQEICRCVSGLLETLKPEYREALRIVDLEEGKLKDPRSAVRHHRRKCGGSRASSQGRASSPDRTGLRHLFRPWLSGLFLREQPTGSRAVGERSTCPDQCSYTRLCWANHPTVIGMSVMVSLPKMSMTLTAMT
jgi:RNA polymerase sigma-70 factor (ECF subfamily)